MWCRRRLRTIICLIVGIIIFLEFPVTEFALRVCVPASELAGAIFAYLTIFDHQELSMPFGLESEARDHKNQSSFDGYVTLTAHFQEDCRRQSPLKTPTARVRQEVLDLVGTVYSRTNEFLDRLGGGVPTQSSVNSVSLWEHHSWLSGKRGPSSTGTAKSWCFSAPLG